MGGVVFLVLLFYYPMFWVSIKLLTPLRLRAGDPPRFKGIHRRNHIVGFTGRASGASTSRTSLTSGSIQGNDYSGYGQVSGSISTTVQVTDTFFLTVADGSIHHIVLVNFSAGIGEGHVVSVAGTARKGAGAAFFVVYNHTTNQGSWKLKDFGPVKPNRFMQVWLAFNLITILPIPLLLIVAVIHRAINWPLFRSRGSRPLFAWFQQRAEQLATQRPESAQVHIPEQSSALPTPPMSLAIDASNGGHSIATSLTELKALRDSGALTADEFEIAKAQVLGT